MIVPYPSPTCLWHITRVCVSHGTNQQEHRSGKVTYSCLIAISGCSLPVFKTLKPVFNHP